MSPLDFAQRSESMSRFVIFTDASADLAQETIEREDIRFIPMNCTQSGQPVTLTGLESEEEVRNFYVQMRSGVNFSTSQITPKEYEHVFRPLLEAGQDIVYIALSSGLTNTVDSANLAREKLAEKVPGARLYVVDSLSATAGMGLLLEKAAALRAEGLDAAEAAARLTELASRVCHVFLVSDLMHLKRGGRLSAASAVMGSVLHICPILIIDGNGKLEVIGKKRGAKAAVRFMVSCFEQSRDPGETAAYCAHSDAPAIVQSLRAEALQAAPELQLRVHSLCPVIGAHTGPDMAALVFFGDRSRLEAAKD